MRNRKPLMETTDLPALRVLRLDRVVDRSASVVTSHDEMIGTQAGSTNPEGIPLGVRTDTTELNSL